MGSAAQANGCGSARTSRFRERPSQQPSCKDILVKVSHFWVPGALVFFTSAGDTQAIACQQLPHHRADLAIGQSLGLVFSTLLAVLLGGFLKWYVYDTHLLLYMSVLFFAELINCVQGSVVDMALHMVQDELPQS